MKRRNAETGKMRRPLKRTKITEGMYGNSMLYLKFVMVWATVVMADYMLEFRFEFLWPFWMMLQSVYDSFKYQGIAFSVFFICIALTSDMICFFFIPLQYVFFAASTYVWVQYVWYTFADKGICVPTVAICCLLVYVEGLWRGSRDGSEFCRPLAAHCVGYPVVNLGFGAKTLIAHRLRLRRQRHVRAMNEFYFQLMRDALPESAFDQSQQASSKEASVSAQGADCATQTQPAGSAQAHGGGSVGAGGSMGSTPGGSASLGADTKHMNGSLRRKCGKSSEHNGHCVHEHAQLQTKLERLEKHLSAHTKSSLTNGSACHATLEDEDRHENSRSSNKNVKLEKKEPSSLKEEKRKNKNKDKDKENYDSHKNTENSKEQIIKDKEIESTKECVKIKECSSNKEKEKEKERDREIKEKEKEREREREREQREARECMEELKRVRAELSAAKAAEAEAKRALAAAAAADRQRRTEHQQLKQAHAALQQRVSAWRTGERAALERRLCEERRARSQAEQMLLRARHATPTSGECENESCRARRASLEAECAALRRDVQRARERQQQLQRDLAQAHEQVRSLETLAEQHQHQQQAEAAPRLEKWAALHERAAHLERALSAETRVKLDLLSALGDAKRNMNIQDGLISKQEKEIEELKAQMLAVMPTEFVSPVSGSVSKLRLSDGSPLDPNATVYTPKRAQCSDA